MTCSFTSLGIQCVKRKDVEESLKLRESIKVDPFRSKCYLGRRPPPDTCSPCFAPPAGFAHKNQASNIDLNVVRLCFQVFTEGPDKDKFTNPLPAVASEPIYDKKAMSELVITKLSHCSATVSGGVEVILLCDRVTKDDIQIRFYEEQQGQLVWEALADFQPNDVHKQVAISFRTPKYYTDNIQGPVCVQIQLRRPSDGHCSDPRPFQFVPREVDPDGLSRKRQKLSDVNFDRFVLASPPRDQPVGASAMNAPPVYVGVPRVATKIKHEVMETASSQAACSGMWAVPDQPQVLFNMPPALADQAGPAVKKQEATRPKYVPDNPNSVDGPLTDKLDSLDLDIDASDLMSDINFNNLMVNLDSGNNITFNSSGNISDAGPAMHQPPLSFASANFGTLNTPQGIEDNRNPLSHFSPPRNPSDS